MLTILLALAFSIAVCAGMCFGFTAGFDRLREYVKDARQRVVRRRSVQEG